MKSFRFKRTVILPKKCTLGDFYFPEKLNLANVWENLPQESLVWYVASIKVTHLISQEKTVCLRWHSASHVYSPLIIIKKKKTSFSQKLIVLQLICVQLLTDVWFWSLYNISDTQSVNGCSSLCVSPVFDWWSLQDCNPLSHKVSCYWLQLPSCFILHFSFFFKYVVHFL